MSRVVVTGPFGTIGQHVVRALVSAGHEVVGLDLDSPRTRTLARTLPAGASVRFGDVTSRTDVEAALDGATAVVHLAAIIPPASDENPALARRVNVDGTRVVLEAMAARCPTARLVFPSSVSVHGASRDRTPPVRVDAPLSAMDVYAGHKIECEALVRASGLRAVILRIGACADPGDLSKGGSRDALLRTTFSIAPDTRIEFLHPLDAAVAITNACVVDGVDGEVLFLGSGASSQLTWRAFTSTVPRAAGLGDFPTDWYGDAPYYTDWMDTAESERLLRYQQHGYPAYEAAIRAQMRFYRPLGRLVRPLVRAVLGRSVRALRTP